jgi:hypothetical protein
MDRRTFLRNTINGIAVAAVSPIAINKATAAHKTYGFGLDEFPLTHEAYQYNDFQFSNSIRGQYQRDLAKAMSERMDDIIILDSNWHEEKVNAFSIIEN